MSKTNMENKDQWRSTDQIADEVFGPDVPQRKTDSLWRKIPHWIVDTGVLSVIAPSALKMYLVLNRFADFRTGQGGVKIEKIVSCSGIHGKSVSRCRRILMQLGLIESRRRGRCLSYRIQMQPPKDIEEFVSVLKKWKLTRPAEAYPKDAKTGKFVRRDARNTSVKYGNDFDQNEGESFPKNIP